MFYHSNVTGVLTLQMFWDSNEATLPLTNVASIQILLGSALLVDIV